MADEKKPPKPGGVRPPDYLYTMALARVEDLMVQAYPWRDLFAKLVSEGYTESEETAKNWRREIQRRWALEDAENRPARKDAWRQRLEGLYRTLIERAEKCGSDLAASTLYGQAIKAGKLAIDMDGLAAPIKVEHVGAVDVLALQPHEREDEIEALLAKRRAALELAQRQGAGKVVH